MPATRIWCNLTLPDDLLQELRARIGGHELILARKSHESNLERGAPDPHVRDSDIAFGQPDAGDIIASDRLKWVHLSSAGYARYDRHDVRQALRSRGGMMTTSSSVYADPCAQHLLAMMLGISRQLPRALLAQQAGRWDYRLLRPAVRTLGGETVLIAGLGAIGRRLIELLGPFHMRICALRRTVRGDEPVPTQTMDQIGELLPSADHVVDLLPAGSNTKHFFDSERLAKVKRGAIFYNVGRGDTVDQGALIEALESGQLGGAYVDVTTPEPLPPEHPLWTAPNCHITPHIAGGHQDERRRLVEHFCSNLRKFEHGEDLLDRIL